MKICRKCGSPYGGTRCNPCRNARRRANWAKLTPEQRHKKYARHYARRKARGYLNRPDVRSHINAQKRARRAAMTEERRAAERPMNNARVLRWIARRREEHNAWRRARYQANLEEQRRAGRQWAASRRARRGVNGGDHTVREWMDKCVLLGGICFYCGEAKPLTRDHKVPIARGGMNNISNILPACMSCNRRKNAMTAEEYLASPRSRRAA